MSDIETDLRQRIVCLRGGLEAREAELALLRAENERLRATLKQIMYRSTGVGFIEPAMVQAMAAAALGSEGSKPAPAEEVQP